MIADIPGARIAYEDTGGSGAPVVFLHAGTGSAPLWLHQLQAFRDAGFRAIAYDRRGHGKTEADSLHTPAMDDLHALMERLGVPRFHLVGTAAGGIVAFDYALSHPDRLRSLVVANSIGGVQDADYLALQKRLRPPPQFDAMPVEFRELGPAYRAAHPDGVARWLALEHSSRHSATRSLPATRNLITFAALATITVPTLLLTGDADLYLPPPILKVFAKCIRGAQSVVIPECGHSAYWEQPTVFNEAVIRFLQSH